VTASSDPRSVIDGTEGGIVIRKQLIIMLTSVAAALMLGNLGGGSYP
jgi:hypothetical protein